VDILDIPGILVPVGILGILVPVGILGTVSLPGHRPPAPN
jgi:hypothetical protein